MKIYKTVSVIIFALIVILSLWGYKYFETQKFTPNEREKILFLFEENKLLFSNVQKFLWKDYYVFSECLPSGSVVLSDGKVISEPEFSPDIKQLYENFQALPCPSLRLYMYDEYKFFSFDFYYPRNRMTAAIRYTEMDVTENEAYEALGNGWYLYSIGLT